MSTDSSISTNLATLLSDMAATARQAGRNEADVRLVAVSKTHPAADILEAARAGQVLFGESRVQEALPKAASLPPVLEWHFIGHLQANKVRKALPHFALFHSVDNLNLARDIARIAAETEQKARVLIEVNISGEVTKYGFSPTALEDSIDSLLGLPQLEIAGLMTMAPYSENPELARPTFAALREFRDRLEARGGIVLPELSMGMSGDFRQAIHEGATLVRVGTAIFGSRPPPIA